MKEKLFTAVSLLLMAVVLTGLIERAMEYLGWDKESREKKARAEMAERKRLRGNLPAETND